MTLKGGKQLHLNQTNDDLDEKLGLVPTRSLSSVQPLTHGDIAEGLKSQSRHEFFARTFVNKRNSEVMQTALKDESIRESLMDMAKEPEKLVEALDKVIGGGVSFIPKHPIRAKRFGRFLGSEEGREFYNEFVSSQGGDKASSLMFSTKAGSAILAGALMEGGKNQFTEMIAAKIRAGQFKFKNSVDKFSKNLKPIDTKHLTDEMMTNSNEGDIALRNHLLKADEKTRFETVSEFFSTEAKFTRFKEFISKKPNKELVATILKSSPAHTTFSFLNVANSEVGNNNLANAIMDKNGSDILSGLVRDEEGSQAAYALYNDGKGRECLGKTLKPSSAGALGKIGMSLAVGRITNKFRGVKPMDDVNPAEVERVVKLYT